MNRETFRKEGSVYLTHYGDARSAYAQALWRAKVEGFICGAAIVAGFAAILVVLR